MFSRILVGYDGSSESTAALRLAAALGGPHAVVIVAHVTRGATGFDDADHEARRVASDPALDRARAILAGLAGLAGRAGVELTAPRGPSVATALHRIGEDTACDLLVVGSGRHHGSGRVRLGGNADATLREAPCAVLVAAGAHRQPIRRIGVGFDGTAVARAAVEQAGALARELGAELTVLGVVDTRHPYPSFGTAGGYGDVRVRAQRSMADVTGAVQGAREPRRQLHEGDPVHELLGLGRESDLLVVGARRRGRLLRLLTGSVSSAVVRRATCPVLVLPAGVPLPADPPPVARV